MIWDSLIDDALKHLPYYQKIESLKPIHPFWQIIDSCSLEENLHRMIRANDLKPCDNSKHTSYYEDKTDSKLTKYKAMLRRKALDFIYRFINDKAKLDYPTYSKQADAALKNFDCEGYTTEALQHYVDKVVWLIPGWLSYLHRFEPELARCTVKAMLLHERKEHYLLQHALNTVNQKVPHCSWPRQRANLNEVATHTLSPGQQYSTHFIFCIDPRSNSLRRKLESHAGIKTHGFAGFLNLPFKLEYAKFKQTSEHHPTIAAPSFTATSTAPRNRNLLHSLVYQVRALCEHPLIALKAIEIIGPLLWLKTLWNSFYQANKFHSAEITPHQINLDLLIQQHGAASFAEAIKQTLQVLNIDLSASQEIIFVGHGSENINNHFSRVLQCGACSGNSSLPNAQLMVGLLKHPAVKNELRKAGVLLKFNTNFDYCFHNTSLNKMILPTDSMLSSKTKRLLNNLNIDKDEHIPEIYQTTARHSNWACITPEYGLVHASTLVFSSRPNWQGQALNQQYFLHDYNYHNDSEGELLGSLFDGPGIVAFNIVASYFYAKLFPEKLSSGSKTTHSYLEDYGIVNEYHGDLLLGLPEESVLYCKKPISSIKPYTILCDAPQQIINKALQRSDQMRYLVQNGWVNLKGVYRDVQKHEDPMLQQAS